MNWISFGSIALAVLIALQSTSLSAQAADEFAIGGASGGNSTTFAKWYDKFCKALSKDDKLAIAKMIGSPLRVYSGGEYDSYTGITPPSKCLKFNSKTLPASYDKVFTHDLKKRILTAKHSEFWDRDMGICLGTGIVWFNVVNEGKDYKIQTISAELAPPDTDLLLKQIQEAEKAEAKTRVASLYSMLGQAYDKFWRSLSDSRSDEHQTFLKKQEAAYKKAISLREGAAAESPEQAKDLELLAEVLSLEQGKAEETESLFEKSFAMQKKVLPADSPAIGQSVRKLEEIYGNSGELIKRDSLLAEDLLRKQQHVHEMETQKPSKKHDSEIIATYIEIAKFDLELGRKSGAANVLDKAYKLLPRVSNIEHLAFDLAPLLAECGKVAEAKTTLSRISDIGNKRECIKSMAMGFAKAGKAKEVDAILDPDIANLKENNFAQLLVDYVEIFVANHDLKKALAIADSAIGGDSSKYGAWEAKAKVEEALGNHAKAEECYLSSMKEQGNPNDKVALSTLEELASVYLKEKKFADVDKTTKQVLNRMDKSGAGYGDMLALQALSYDGQSLPAKAEPLFKKAIDIKLKAQGPAHKSVITLMQNYANFLDKNHKTSEANAVKEQIKAVGKNAH